MNREKRKRSPNTKYDSTEWVGKKFGMLTVVEPVHVETSDGKSSSWYWKVKCDCGNEKVMQPYKIINGKNVSCGCYGKAQKVNLRHGESHTHLHNIWCGMNNRCNPDHKDSENYGGRGIRVCDEWASYESFADWARHNGYEEGLSIERKDVNGNYCPENCTWIPLEKQARNRRTTHWVEWQGRKMSLAEAAEISGLPYKQVHLRLKSGWSLEEALTKPLCDPHARSELHDKCDELGLDYHVVYNRIYTYGWDVDRAMSTPTGRGKGWNSKNSAKLS